jgi:ABC-type glutathione transport system ATPase component
MPDARPPVLELLGVSKSFRRRDGSLQHAVKAVDLTVYAGETVALVGESGSGKTSLARIALALLKPDAGDVLLQGQSLVKIEASRLREVRTAMQPVFQDSSAAFNPRRTVAQAMGQAIVKTGLTERQREAQIIKLLEQVRLTPGGLFLNRFPHELSGGQRQRLAIARAIAMDPVLIIADEPLSGADVSIRGEILNLLLELQAQRGVAYLFVTHDISIARAFAHRVAVMYQGSLVEQGPADEVIDRSKHPYTQRLVAASVRRELC